MFFKEIKLFSLLECLIKLYEKYVNDFTSKYGKVLTIDDIKLPLTGSRIVLSGNDIFELYLIFCNYFSLKIKLEDYYDFYTIERIAITIIRQKDRRYEF